MAIKNNIEDTIVAISTPVSGEGGIGIVRLSGPDSISIADKIFFSKDGKKPSEYSTHTVHYGWIKEEDKIVDEVLLTVMKAPKTYTREDIVEISGHGGPIVLRKILDLCIKNGGRLARPGEFTERAFLNGRIDLLQAEAVCDLIRSKTSHSANIIANQLKGVLSEKIKKIRKELINLISNIEVSLDYSEEDIKFISNKETEEILKTNIEKIEEILKALKKGNIYKEGIKVCIIGKPNVGKSSLLNALVSDDRSIVSHIPGTTRDVVSETFCIRDIPVTIMDTAGIGLTKTSEDENFLQKLSEEKTLNAISKSDIILFIVDISSGVTEEDIKIADNLSKKNKKTILVINKIDLKKNDAKEIFEKLKKYNFFESITCSALYKINIDKLEDKIVQMTTGSNSELSTPDTIETEFIGNARQEQALTKASENLVNALNSISNNESLEFSALYIKSALDSLGELIGETTTEEILDTIFSKFCVGK